VTSNSLKDIDMKQRLNRLVPLLALGLGSLAAHAAQPLVQFHGGIGVTPWAVGTVNGATAPVQNTVFDINPGGRPWVIDTLKARVSADGQIRVKGTGLILAGGNSVGTSGGVPKVFATLFCGTVAHDSPPTVLEANGDFTIKDTLLQLPPSQCTAPVLLIRNAGNRSWFAAGIPVTDDEHHDD
jgi:hypothetical protein